MNRQLFMLVSKNSRLFYCFFKATFSLFEMKKALCKTSQNSVMQNKAQMNVFLVYYGFVFYYPIHESHDLNVILWINKNCFNKNEL